MTTKARKRWALLWLLCPVALVAFHYGPGKEHQARGEGRERARLGAARLQSEEWEATMALCDEALALLPGTALVERAGVRIIKAEAMSRTGGLREATSDLQSLLGELTEAQQKGEPVSDELLRETRQALGSARYYNGWVRRLEGASTEDWVAETTQARQHFRYLAETDQDGASDDTIRKAHQRDLEAAVRLERMDMSELKVLPLPEQVRRSACQRPGEGKGQKGQQPGIGEGEGPPEDMRGAGKGRRPPGGGS